MFTTSIRRRAAMTSCALAGLGVAAVAAAPAQAASLTSTTCAADSSLSQPFAPWGDTNEYRLLPGGDFSDGGASWTLAGGAAVVAGGDPFSLTGASASASLSLPAGASAQSSYTCVDITQPTFRFADVATTAGGSVLVSVVYQVPPAGTVAVPVGTLTPGGGWSPSPTFQNGAAIAGLLNGGTAQMAVRFTAVSGTTQLDDVFVDPHSIW